MYICKLRGALHDVTIICGDRTFPLTPLFIFNDILRMQIFLAKRLMIFLNPDVATSDPDFISDAGEMVRSTPR